MDRDVQGKQRFAKFDRAVTLLREPFERDIESLSPLDRHAQPPQSLVAYL